MRRSHWDRKWYPPEFSDVIAKPFNYTRNSGLPSVISWRAVDYMKLCNEPKINFPNMFHVCIFWEAAQLPSPRGLYFERRIKDFSLGIWEAFFSKLRFTPTPWSGPFRDHGLNTHASTANPMHEGFSMSGARFLGCAQGVGVDPSLLNFKRQFLGGHFGPEKKYLAPPLSPQTFPRRPSPSRASSSDPPPSLTFYKKPAPRPPPRRPPPPPRPGTEKNKKYPKRPPRFFWASITGVKDCRVATGSISVCRVAFGCLAGPFRET